MKFKTLLMMAIIAITAVSCGSDKKEPIVDVYSGTLEIKTMQMTLENKELKLTKISEHEGIITFPEYKMFVQQMQRETGLEVFQLKVSISGNKIYAQGKVTPTAKDPKIGELTIQVTDKLSYTVSGKLENKMLFLGELKDDKITVSYGVRPGEMPFAIEHKFDGTKKK